MDINGPQANRIDNLGALLEAQDLATLPPVDKWDPPYRGDIGMSIKADGTWYYQGSPINRQSLVRLFARVLRRDADDRHYLVTPSERVDVTVEDAPFLAVELQIENPGRGQELIFRTNVDDIVRCGPQHPLRFETEAGSGGLKPYLRVRGHLEALVTRAVYYDLIELAITPVERPNGVDPDQPGIWSGGKFFPIADTTITA